MIIYWRVCEKPITLSGVPRWNGVTKPEVVRRSWLALQQGIVQEDKIIIVEDVVPEVTLEWLVNHSRTKNITIENCTATPEKPYYTKLVDIMERETKAHPNEIHYLCNDDFLHLPFALHHMRSIYDDGWPGFVLLYDYPDRYTLDKTRFNKLTHLTEMYMGKTTHWRTVVSCTGCTSARGHVWQQIMTIFRQNALYNSDAFTWEAYAKHGAICPVPGQATHLTEGVMTPYVNWENYWESIKYDY